MEVEIHFTSLDMPSMEARIEAMARPCYSAVSMYAKGGQPCLLFVPSRRHAHKLALDLLTFSAADGEKDKFLLVRAREAAAGGFGSWRCHCSVWDPYFGL